MAHPKPSNEGFAKHGKNYDFTCKYRFKFYQVVTIYRLLFCKTSDFGKKCNFRVKKCFLAQAVNNLLVLTGKSILFCNLKIHQEK